MGRSPKACTRCLLVAMTALGLPAAVVLVKVLGWGQAALFLNRA